MRQPLKIQFGTGAHPLPSPWLNTDLPQVDIRKPLPFPAQSASRLYSSHTIEHVSPAQAWAFLEECHRILRPGGVVRVAFPNLVRLSVLITKEYQQAAKVDGYGNGSRHDALKAVICAHGHQSAWTENLMIAMMEAIGFRARSVPIGESAYADLRGVEQHGKVVGENVSRVETSVVEGVKV